LWELLSIDVYVRRQFIHRNWRLAALNKTTVQIHSVFSALKMVNDTICISGDRKLDNVIIAKLQSQSTASIKNTRVEFVRFKPIAISIKAKRPGIDEDTGEVKLGG
jgi:hypothetical protein